MPRAPDRLIDVGGRRVHMYCRGQGRPVVVFEAALAGCHLNWCRVQESVARFTTTCSYDRAGLGWSDPAPPPRTARQIVDDLYALLANAGFAPPYVLVAHSFGALPARLYSAIHGSDVCGLMLIDPAEPSEWMPLTSEQRRHLSKGVTLCRRGALAARLGLAEVVARLAGVAAFRAARFIVAIMSRREFRRPDEHILAPFHKSPSHLRPVLREFWTRPSHFEAIAAEIDGFAESASQAAHGTLGRHLPLVVLSATDSPPSRLRARNRMADGSSRGRHRVAAASGHWIQLDQPEWVVEEIRGIVDVVRSSAAGLELLASRTIAEPG